MSDSKRQSRPRQQNGKAGNTNANLGSLAHNKKYTSLRPEYKRQVETVKEYKPDWTDDEVISFAAKYEYDNVALQEALTNAFEGLEPRCSRLLVVIRVSHVVIALVFGGIRCQR